MSTPYDDELIVGALVVPVVLLLLPTVIWLTVTLLRSRR
ncbi:hypothetical protein HD595_002726 [Nonomuraea roseoviolacea subsp. carminata]|uniref:Uncharacterized protein n=1 Tax=Nonomuraea roseoviolacea subsp. carminata TaxID=160689 RepID=A0ABT1JXX4_9ACTN|nr:hypothetical protein [Nonomuraea roseoviolacea subsp. carminata]